MPERLPETPCYDVSTQNITYYGGGSAAITYYAAIGRERRFDKLSDRRYFVQADLQSACCEYRDLQSHKYLNSI